jgi:hypothetical protein
MKVNELRVGNLILIKYTNDEGSKFRQYLLKAYQINDIKENPKDYKAIELSEEWFLKFGAEKINHINGYSFWTFNTKKLNVCIDIYETYTKVNTYFSEHIKYVHQLQNLYFCLTGNELIIKNT